MNKGKKLRFCKECNCKRFTSQVRKGDMYHLTCSKGHTWMDIVGTLEQINELASAVIMPGLMEQMFSESPLMAYLRR